MKSLIYLLVLFVGIDSLYAESGWEARIPNGQKNTCMNCHFTLDGGDNNSFGKAFKNAGKRWTKTLSQIDTDGDTFTNGQELQDPTGVWTTATGYPFGDPSLVTLPGNVNDFPSGVEEVTDKFISLAYPNPVLENTTFEISNISSNGLEILTYDINGNIVKSEKINANGNVNYIWNRTNSQNQSLPSGTYYLEFITDNLNQKRKVVVE
ncbi:MAG: T9SS type A sorting domain-containing protein [Candidatus Kapaibacteriota bacterium]